MSNISAEIEVYNHCKFLTLWHWPERQGDGILKQDYIYWHTCHLVIGVFGFKMKQLFHRRSKSRGRQSYFNFDTAICLFIQKTDLKDIMMQIYLISEAHKKDWGLSLELEVRGKAVLGWSTVVSWPLRSTTSCAHNCSTFQPQPTQPTTIATTEKHYIMCTLCAPLYN